MAAAILFLAATPLGGLPTALAQPPDSQRSGQDPVLKTGRQVYQAACAACHGIRGDGQGPGGRRFEFAATDFRRGLFKLRSTKLEALPTDEDLKRVIRVGMPGTEMVPFGGILSPASIEAVAAYIKTFGKSFRDPKQSLKPADRVNIPQTRPAGPTAQSIAAGRELFKREECQSCHGASGDGRGPDAAGMTDDRDRPLRMLDFRRGHFKSGHADLDLLRTITTGMNGTPMESYLDSTTPEEKWQLVDFIRSLDETPGDSSGGFFGYLFGDNPSGLDYGP